MTSIRTRLFVILLTTTTLVWLSAFVWVQQSTRDKVERVLDARLAEAGQMVSSLLSDQRIDVSHAATLATNSGSTGEFMQAAYSHRLSCQIWSLDGTLVGRSGSSPAEQLTNQDTGFSQNVIDGEAWRVYSVVNEDLGVRIMVGDSYIVRDRLVDDVAKGLVLPALLMLPIMAVLILLSLQRGLAPIDRMARALALRPAEDLSPVDAAILPREIKPMAQALNGLFSRVNAIRDREKSFTSFAAHELKTPLAGIKIQAQVAAMAPDAQTRQQALNRIQDGVTRADRMVRQLLALATLDRDDPRDDCNADVLLVIKSVVSDLARVAVAQQVTLQIEDRPTYLAKVNSDLLTVAVRNIVENAIMASPKGESVQIEVVQNDRHVVIAVSDRGRGIPDADLPHIADRFYRGKNAPTGGSGLGLSIVAAAVQRLTGTVEFQARPDGGEIVTLRIPVSPDVNTK